MEVLAEKPIVADLVDLEIQAALAAAAVEVVQHKEVVLALEQAA